MMARSSSLRTELRALALRVARLRPLQPLVAFFYSPLHRFLFKDPLCQNDHWTAVHHPQPEYPVHILILPRRMIKSLHSAPSEDPALYTALILLVQSLIEDLKLADHGYRLITNGGPNQSIPIWHWHLVCEASCKDSDTPGVKHA